ncbi:hypothetical protein ABI59_08180 [Acidobacteria bacterium Mor1]|nr:hypothetical protein ABI59_08180 [Acidobacteria bacterium Mor1]
MSEHNQTRIAVVGAAGMLGGALVRLLQESRRPFVALTRRELDLERLDRIAPALSQAGVGAVINASAYSDVNGAERDDQRELAFRINRDVPGALARTCKELSIPLLHVSTDFVFDGKADRPYREDDPTCAVQAYGRSKLEGEWAVQEVLPGALIARTSTLYGPGERERPHYVDAILRQAREKNRIEVVEKPVSSPTYAPDLAGWLLALLDLGAGGILHTVNAGHCSRFQLAGAAVEEAGYAGRVEVAIRPAPPATLERPDFSPLDTTLLAETLGRPPRPWREALREYVGRYHAPGS